MARGPAQDAIRQQQSAEAAVTMRTLEVVRKIKVEVSQEYRDNASRELADSTLIHNQLVGDRTKTVSDYTTRIKKQAGIMEDRARIVQEGLLEREVRCVQEFNDVTGQTRVIKKNGEVVEDWRAMTAAEAQLAIPEEPEEGAAGDGDGDGTGDSGGLGGVDIG